MKKNTGSIDLIIILPLLIILLWGFALCYAYLFEQQQLNQHLWQAGISQWNNTSFNYYKQQLHKHRDQHLNLKYNKTSLVNITWLHKLPLSFKLFQQKNRPYHLTLSSNKKLYDSLIDLDQWVNSKNKTHINIQNSIILPDHKRKNSQQQFLLKHGLWTEGMCKVGFAEPLLPLLGIDILQQTMMGIKLPFTLPKIENFPNIGCQL